MHLVYGSVRTRCPRCVREPALRIQWGCDKAAPVPIFAITCPVCSGWDLKCKTCNGSGDKRLYRCAPSYITHEVGLALDCYKAFENGVLPSPGGWVEQTASFGRIVRAIDAERGAIEAERSRKPRGKRPKGKR